MKKDRVEYKVIDKPVGRQFFEVVMSESPDYQVGDTFSDDDMSMGSSRCAFVEVKE